MRGFTLLETIIAIVIIEVGIIALTSLGVSTLKQGRYIINETIAANLAQEGLELVRNIRDTNTIAENNPWDKGINNINRGIISYDNPVLNNISGAPADPIACGNSCLIYKNTNGFYTHSGGTKTKFYRMIKVDHQFNKDTITCQVGWIDYGKQHLITTITKLYDWQ